MILRLDIHITRNIYSNHSWSHPAEDLVFSVSEHLYLTHLRVRQWKSKQLHRQIVCTLDVASWSWYTKLVKLVYCNHIILKTGIKLENESYHSFRSETFLLQLHYLFLLVYLVKLYLYSMSQNKLTVFLGHTVL